MINVNGYGRITAKRSAQTVHEHSVVIELWENAVSKKRESLLDLCCASILVHEADRQMDSKQMEI